MRKQIWPKLESVLTIENIEYKIATSKEIDQIKNLLNSVRGSSSNLKPKNFIVAMKNDQVIGCIRLKKIGNNYELASLAVVPEYRNKKIGSNLVQKIINQKTEKIFLFCFRDNVGFYKKNGFIEIEPENLPEALQSEFFRLKNVFSGDKKIAAMVIKK